MSAFSIDDVRETFTTDVSNFLGQIEDGAQQLLSEPALALPPVGLPDGRPIFEAIADFGHALGGTTSLVGADSLTESAHALEELARGGQQALAELVRCAARAQQAARLCLTGAQHMRTMLEKELIGETSQALWESLEWFETLTREGVPVGRSGRSASPATAEAVAPPLVEPGTPPEESSFQEDLFAFAADPAAGEGSSHEVPVSSGVPSPDTVSPFAFEETLPASINQELRRVFDEEARGVLSTLRQELRAFHAEPGHLGTLGNLERLFHTLKGAAATVGLVDVSAAAARLQMRMEEALESGTPPSGDLLLAETGELLRLAGLPGLEEGNAPPAPDATATLEETRRFFFEEARGLIDEVTAALAPLGGSDAEAAARGHAELGRLFHRLKGSALIVGETEISAEAERLQVLLESGQVPPDAPAQVQAALTVVRARLSAEGAVEPARPAPVRRPVQVTVNAELWEAFLQDCRDLTDAIETELLGLEESDQPKQALEAVLRHCHTLKGVVNTVGLSPTGELLHRVEDLLEALLAAPILPPMRLLATLLLGVQADVRKHLAQAKEGHVELDMPRLEARIARLLGKAGGDGERGPGATVAGLSTMAQPSREGASVHSIYSARSLRRPRSQDSVSPAAPSAGDALDRKYIRVATDRLDALMNLAGELVVSRSRLLTRVGALRGLQRDIGFGSRRLIEAVDDFRGEHEFANLDGRRGRPAVARGPGKPGAPAGGAEAKGAWEQFGELELDHYEDIHILSRRLAEMTSDFNEISVQLSRNIAAFNDDSDVFGRIVSGIQGEVTRARMVPLDQLFARLRLPVRDAASREGKEVRVGVEGADVHIDKTIADALIQPMLHLVRNAAVHGVESSAARERAGKPPTATILLRARQESGQIVVEVNDDGAGLDLERLRARGVAMGLVSADTPLDDPAIRDLVFVPGLSTRAQAGAVSGRGVGCDVVRRTVERLNGTIRVESSTGRGTTFIITLPVTLAITKALIVRQGERTYAIPLHFAERIIDAEEEALIHSAGVHRIKVEGTFLTVGRLEQHFGQSGKSTTRGPVLLLRVGTARTALQVDAVLGQEELVVKNMGDLLNGHPLFAGVTIRGSGDLVLIVDVPGLMEERGAKARERRPALGRTEAAAPLAPVTATAAPSAPAAESRASGPLRVLFIDDSLSVRKFAQMTLNGLGVEVTLAVDGVDGMAKLREGSFDLVFTDLEMPRMHGFELIRELRFLPAYQDLPIVVVTSRSGHKHQEQARALGATEYLTKPFTAQGLDVVLKRWGRRRLQPAPAEPSAEGTPPILSERKPS